MVCGVWCVVCGVCNVPSANGEDGTELRPKEEGAGVIVGVVRDLHEVLTFRGGLSVGREGTSVDRTVDEVTRVGRLVDGGDQEEGGEDDEHDSVPSDAAVVPPGAEPRVVSTIVATVVASVVGFLVVRGFCLFPHDKIQTSLSTSTTNHEVTKFNESTRSGPAITREF